MHQHINMKPKNGIETHNISKKETDFNENFPLFVSITTNSNKNQIIGTIQTIKNK